MTIKKRVEALERKAGGTESQIVFFKTFYENKEGGLDYEVWLAAISSGPSSGTHVQRVGDETYEEFEARCRRVANGGMAGAQK